MGKDHETLGSDFLAVSSALRLPEETLGELWAKRLEGIDADAWYPASWLIEMTSQIEERVGPFALRQVGRKAFRLSQAATRKTARSARDILHGMNDMYRRVNRGTHIGEWKLLDFGPGRAELRKTTPHHCVMVEGILLEALASVGVPTVVEQSTCVRRDGKPCVYVVTSAVIDTRWSGVA
jgi:hypothetical protein